MDASEKLKNWFDELSRHDKEAVLQFLYPGRKIPPSGSLDLVPHMYCGPAPTGASGATSTAATSCPHCGASLTIDIK